MKTEIMVNEKNLSDGSPVYSVLIIQDEQRIELAAVNKRGAWMMARQLKSAMLLSTENVIFDCSEK